MATLLSLKRRIKAAQNVSKTTRAMQMIAASKLRKAQDAATSSRPYVEKLSQLTHRISNNTEGFSHKYLTTGSNTGKKLILVFSPDKGLCGGLITNLVREVLKYNSSDYHFLVVGKKAENYVARFHKELVASFPFGNTLPAFEKIFPLLSIIEEQYGTHVDSVSILSTEFISVFSQKPALTPLLPIVIPNNDQEHTAIESFTLFEPSSHEILPALLKRYVEMTVYQQMLESYVSEQAARMLSMQNATNNAKDIIQDLRLEYNKTRQAKITSEILDIAGGAALLKHAN